VTRLAAPSGGAAGPAVSVAGENLIAFDLDKLFRADPPSEGDLDYGRAEAARQNSGDLSGRPYVRAIRRLVRDRSSDGR